MTRQAIEAVAARFGIGRLDALDDDAVRRLVLVKALPGVDANGSPEYVTAAFDAAFGAGEAKRDAAERERVVRHDGSGGDLVPMCCGRSCTPTSLCCQGCACKVQCAAICGCVCPPDAGAKMDAATASVAQLRDRYEAARAAFKADSERAYLEPIGARADDGGPTFAAGTLAALAEGLSAEHRAAAGVPGVPSAEEAAAKFRRATEEAWKTVPATATTSLLGVAEELSRRLGR